MFSARHTQIPALPAAASQKQQFLGSKERLNLQLSQGPGPSGARLNLAQYKHKARVWEKHKYKHNLGLVSRGPYQLT